MSEIYFAQPSNGGPIKVGTTRYGVRRIVSIATWHPQGVEVIATIPGSLYREAAIHYLLRPFNIGRDWFRSCADVWSFLLDARAGQLSWLPAEPNRGDGDLQPAMLRRRVHIAFGSDRSLLTICGFKTKQRMDEFYREGSGPSCKLHGALVIRELAIGGLLPPYTHTWPADPLRIVSSTDGGAA